MSGMLGFLYPALSGSEISRINIVSEAEQSELEELAEALRRALLNSEGSEPSEVTVVSDTSKICITIAPTEVEAISEILLGVMRDNGIYYHQLVVTPESMAQALKALSQHFDAP